jgi:hypothetical protein
MSDAAPAAAAVAAEKKPFLRRFRRPPTSVVMTLLGIALTAWLLPAVARQWDDRQKAAELKASLVAEVASASANALTGGEEILIGRSNGAPRAFSIPAAEKQWSITSLELESRLRAYFAPAIANVWTDYSYYVNAALLMAAGSTVTNTVLQTERLFGKKLLPRQFFLVLHALDKPMREFEFNSFSLTGRLSAGSFHNKRATLLADYRDVEQRLLAIQQRIATYLLAATPRGYSVTTHDFVHDLVP